MFAGSCIGVLCLAIFLELLRRSVKEWDRYLIKQYVAQHTGGDEPKEKSERGRPSSGGVAVPPFRPNWWQQGVRSLLHTAQFTVAYFIMLLGTQETKS